MKREGVHIEPRFATLPTSLNKHKTAHHQQHQQRAAHRELPSISPVRTSIERALAKRSPEELSRIREFLRHSDDDPRLRNYRVVNLIHKLPALNAAVEKAIDEIEFSEKLEFDSESVELKI